MGLKEVQEELKGQIEEAEKAENAALEEQNKALDTPDDEPKKEEPAKEEPKVEEPKKEEPKEPERVKTPSDYAAERHKEKARLLADDLAAANARIAELTRPRQEVITHVDAEPNKAEDPQSWNEWKLKQTEIVLKKTQEDLGKVVEITAEEQRRRASQDLRSKAEREVEGYEAKVRQQAPDYDEAKRWYANMVAASMKIINPEITSDELVRGVNDALLMKASKYAKAGHDNPIAAIYQEVKALGFQPQAKPSNDTAKEIKPDLAKVAANRSRNAGTAAAQGDTGRGELTPKVAAAMTNKEFAKLKPEEKQRLFSQLQQAG